MLNFKTFLENLEVDIMEILEEVGVENIESENDYIYAEMSTKEQIEKIFESLPDNIDFEIEVYSKDTEEKVEEIDDEDDIEITLDEIDDSKHEYGLFVYLDNAELDDQMDEVKRTIKINAKGKRRIKMRCNQGYRWTGTKCVKISGKERLTKRKAIRKAIRTRKKKGKGALRRTNLLRKRAMKKRKARGL